MSAPDAVVGDALAAAPPEKMQYQPHKAWYRRADVLVPLLLIALGYTFLIVVVEEKSFFRTRITPDGTKSFDWMYFWHLMPLMWQGLQVLLKATVLGFTLAAGLGFLLALGRRSCGRPTR